ncbi:MAG TPA: hypothetical protein VK659_10325 [Asanoa sp.]|nr:hypothetical protein [Asanoa sp.]
MAYQLSAVIAADAVLRAVVQGQPAAVVVPLPLMGVQRSGQHDEFDALGLGRHRDTEEWLTA